MYGLGIEVYYEVLEIPTLLGHVVAHASFASSVSSEPGNCGQFQQFINPTA